ncbi:MAG: hypothetical protein U9N42_02670 [Campylobacterota bacterium]|nr:hypothetical protein [Campylobacterota bacterium]
MNYQAELNARLEAVRQMPIADEPIRLGEDNTHEMITNELFQEFNLSKYDLDETDILRAIKIESILERYDGVFRKHYALKMFYSIAKAGVIMPINLQELINRPQGMFDMILHRMHESNLIFTTNLGELELTDEGKSLAARLGVDIFI